HGLCPNFLLTTYNKEVFLSFFGASKVTVLCGCDTPLVDCHRKRVDIIHEDENIELFSAGRCDVLETLARTNRACYWVGSFNMSVIRVCWLVAAVVTLFLGSSDKAEVRNFTVNQRPLSDTVTEGDTSVTFICKASGYPTPTLRISFGSTQVSQSEQTSADKITSETVLTYTIPRVHCDDKGNYTCTADNGFTGAASVSVHLNINSCGKKPDEDLPVAAIVGGVLGVLLVLTTAALVGVLIWMKRNPRYEKPLPRRERKSDAYTGLQPPDNNTDQQSTGGIVNPQLQAELDESDRLHSYQNVLSPLDNTYDPLQMTERQNTAVYTELRSTGPGGRETDKAEVRNFTINQHQHSDTVTEGVTFICEASGHPTPTLHISFGSEQVALNATEDTPLAAIVGGVVGGILVLTTATVVGVLIWMKRNSRYEKPLPRRERESDAYTGIQPSNNDADRQTAAGIANHQLTTDLDEENCLHNYQNLPRPDNTYDPLQMTGRQDTAVYTDLHPTGSGGRGTDEFRVRLLKRVAVDYIYIRSKPTRRDSQPVANTNTRDGGNKAEVHNFTVNQRPLSDTVTERDTSVTFICKASGYPTPTLRITFGSTQVSQSEQTSADKITSETVLTYTIPRVHCDDKGNYTCTADNGFTGAASVSVQLNINSCGKKPDEDLPAAAIVGGVLGVLLVLTTSALVGVLIWMKRNPRYEKPLPRRERKSDTYTGLQPPDNNTDRQSTAGIVNPQLPAELDESDRLHSYQNVLSSPDNTYDPLQMRERQNTAVYTELRTTGPGGRETGGPFDLDSECMESQLKTDRAAGMVA
ncbi:hypothetical protein BaRGS_00011258, partial [Batillaria attramentaria]